MNGATLLANPPGQRLRELLPAVHNAGGVSPNLLRQESTWHSVTIPRRTLNAGACQACKRRKCKCNGDRPRCLACAQKDSDCVYDDVPLTRQQTDTLKNDYHKLEKQFNTYDRVFKLLKEISDAKATTLLTRIREGQPLEAVMDSDELIDAKRDKP